MRFFSDDEQSSSAPSNLRQCSICNRRFTEHRLDEHQRACQSSSQTSDRYHYNSQLHRWKGLNYRINARPQQFQSPKTFWREKHQQLQAAIKADYHPIGHSIQSSDDRPYQCSRCHRKFATENAVTKHQKGCSNKRPWPSKTRDFSNKKIERILTQENIHSVLTAIYHLKHHLLKNPLLLISSSSSFCADEIQTN